MIELRRRHHGAVLRAAGYNLRWLLRTIARGRIGRLFFALCSAALQLLLAVSVTLLPSRQRSTSVVAAAG
ncbi:MAG TPA: hypothetical protein PKC29_14930 [Thermodesulfobacteriota bacterium]|nr:hypothetical protein [Thermodesulfobacteriota bacterium]